ncbi:MAG TPA: hypothetical protein O0X27_05825, partial [Methanocorpusculum sp.]|nr:hypothetical protein [Methanocorpusculum sp.]
RVMTSLTLCRLSAGRTYTRKELQSCLPDGAASASNNAFSWILKRELEAGRLHHVGRDTYSLDSASMKDTYTHVLSEPAGNVLRRITAALPLVTVQIWETRQYNEFLNHQIGMNTIFLEAEKLFLDSVYEVLDRMPDVHVLVQPRIGDFLRYQKENTVVLIRCTSESPALKSNPHLPAIEKLLVDLKANRYLQAIVDQSEIGEVFSQAYAHYCVSTGTLRRYALRRTAWEKVEPYLPPEAAKREAGGR